MAMILDKFEAELFDRFGWTTEEIKSMKENQIKINEEHKLMTKAEAIERHAETQTNSMLEYWSETKAKSKLFIEGLEALGLIKFKEEKKIVTLYKSNNLPLYGVAKIELWPEGLVVWVGGIIKYKSWES